MSKSVTLTAAEWDALLAIVNQPLAYLWTSDFTDSIVSNVEAQLDRQEY
jgi:hypothetical protein